MPGWQTIGSIYHDLVFRIDAPDPLATARALARIDWSRTGELWTDLVIEKELVDGRTELILNSAGASTKRTMLEKVRNTIGIDSLLVDVDAQSEQEVEAAVALAGDLDPQENVQVTA